MDMHKIGSQVSRLRRRAGLSQAQLAKKAGLHVNTVAGIENNHSKTVNVDTVERLAKALDADPWRIMFGAA